MGRLLTKTSCLDVLGFEHEALRRTSGYRTDLDHDCCGVSISRLHRTESVRA